MFEGGGFGVGVAVADLRPWPVEALPPGIGDPAELTPAGAVDRPARIGEMLPVAARSDAELAVELQRLVAVEAALAAYKAELVVEFAGRRPACVDVPAGRSGAAVHPVDELAELEASLGGGGISEFFADELALVLNSSRAHASTLLGQSLTLRGRLPGTWAALADGALDWPRARGLAAELGAPSADTDPAVVAAVEAALLPTAAQRSVRGLRRAAGAELLARDAAAVARRRRMVDRGANVTVRPLPEGMAELSASLPAGLAAACLDAVDRLARMLQTGGDARPIGFLRSVVLGDLILRPWDVSRPAVTGHVTVLAPVDALTGTVTGRGEPAPVGEVDGLPIAAEQLRELLTQLDAVCPGGLRAPAGGDLTIALTDSGTGRLRASVTRAQLEALARRGCPIHDTPTHDTPAHAGRARRPDAAGAAGRGCGRADDTDGAGDEPAARDRGDGCGCPVVDVPPPVDRYRPSAAQRRFVLTRDRGCRHPGCANRAGWADLDHVVAHAAGGPTACENLCCLCRRHHRLKTHARGWTFAMAEDGTLTVTTPSGVTRTTRPPGYRPLPHATTGRGAADPTGWRPPDPNLEPDPLRATPGTHPTDLPDDPPPF